MSLLWRSPLHEWLAHGSIYITPLIVTCRPRLTGDEGESQPLSFCGYGREELKALSGARHPTPLLVMGEGRVMPRDASLRLTLPLSLSVCLSVSLSLSLRHKFCHHSPILL